MIPWKLVLSGLVALGFTTGISDWRSLDPAVLHQMAAEVWAEVGGTGEVSLDGLVDALALKGRESADVPESIDGISPVYVNADGSLDTLLEQLRAAIHANGEVQADLEAQFNH